MLADSRAFGVLNLFVAKLLRAPLWLALSAILARVLEPQGLGIWSMILAAAMFLNQSLLYWTQAVTQRYGRGEWLESQSLGRTLSLRALLLAPGLAFLLLLLNFLSKGDFSLEGHQFCRVFYIFGLLY